MANLQNGKMKKMEKLQNGKSAKWQNGKILKWQNGKKAKRWSEKVSDGPRWCKIV